MNKLFLITALIIMSCTLSNEEKAQRLVEETLKDYLFHPDSYEPISTEVDSIFVDITTIESILKVSEEIKELMSKIQKYKSDVESAESSIDLWTPDTYSTQYERGQYGRAKKEKEKAQLYVDKYTKKLLEKIALLKEHVSKYRKGEFTGWLLVHRFRSLNGAGTMAVPGQMIFFCDKEFTTCDGYEPDKLDNFVEVLEAVDVATSDEDIIEYFNRNDYLNIDL